jgi:hypothetical protein
MVNEKQIHASILRRASTRMATGAMRAVADMAAAQSEPDDGRACR